MITATRDGAVAVIYMDRPEVLNAFVPAMFDGLLQQLQAASLDDDVRTVVLTGRGRAFCAGIDLKELGARVSKDGAEGERATIEAIQSITRALVELPKVVIAAVNGPAVGFGAELAVAADIRCAADGSSFSFPEVQRALFATGGSTRLLPLLVGTGRASEWLLTGRSISAREALDTGLVTKLTPENRLMEEVMTMARQIAGNAPVPVGRLKRLLQEAPGAPLADVLAREVDGAVGCLETEDFREGVRSFLEKRSARFTGH